MRPGEPVIVRGTGLAFVDLAVLLFEGRGGRYEPDPELGHLKMVVRSRDGKVTVSREPLDDLPDDLRQLFEEKPSS